MPATEGRRTEGAALFGSSWIVPGGAALALVLLGLVNIGRSFNYDEAITYGYFINGGSLRQALTTQVIFNNHQMFSATQAVGWRIGLVGESAQRLGPIAAGAATVAMTSAWTVRRTTIIAGAVTATVLVLNPIFLEQVRLLRGYSLATAAIVAAGWALHASWHDTRRRWLVLQALCMVVAVTSHAYSALTILALAVASGVLGHVRRAHIVTWATAAITAIAIAFPILDDAQRAADARGNRFNANFPEFATRALLGGTTWIAFITAALALAGAVAVGQRSSRHGWAVAAASAVILAGAAAMWLIVQPTDLYARFFMSVVPLIAALAGVGASLLPRPAIGGVALLLAVLLLPGANDLLDADSTIRDAAGVAASARLQELDVCGWQPEPLLAYGPPVRPIAGVDDFGTCEVYITVLGINQAQREAATDHFEGSTDLGGGIRVWATDDFLDQLGR